MNEIDAEKEKTTSLRLSQNPSELRSFKGSDKPTPTLTRIQSAYSFQKQIQPVTKSKYAHIELRTS